MEQPVSDFYPKAGTATKKPGPLNGSRAGKSTT
jgi:hypothetical protein